MIFRHLREIINWCLWLPPPLSPEATGSGAGKPQHIEGVKGVKNRVWREAGSGRATFALRGNWDGSNSYLQPEEEQQRYAKDLLPACGLSEAN